VSDVACSNLSVLGPDVSPASTGLLEVGVLLKQASTASCNHFVEASSKAFQQLQAKAGGTLDGTLGPTRDRTGWEATVKRQAAVTTVVTTDFPIGKLPNANGFGKDQVQRLEKSAECAVSDRSTGGF